MRNLSRALILSVASIAACSCAGDGEASTGSPPSRHWIVAADLSGSRNTVELNEARAFVQGLGSVVSNGDAVTLLRLYERGLADSTFMWQTIIPSRRDPTEVRASDSLAIQDFSDELQVANSILFAETVRGTLQGTDIFSTLQRIRNIIQARPGYEARLVLVSDMLHSTSSLDMERRLPAEGWLQTAVRDGLVPNLLGACVIVMGAEESTRRAASLRHFWIRYFESAHATLAVGDFRHYAPKPWNCAQPDSSAMTELSPVEPS